MLPFLPQIKYCVWDSRTQPHVIFLFILSAFDFASSHPLPRIIYLPSYVFPLRSDDGSTHTKHRNCEDQRVYGDGTWKTYDSTLCRSLLAFKMAQSWKILKKVSHFRFIRNSVKPSLKRVTSQENIIVEIFLSDFGWFGEPWQTNALESRSSSGIWIWMLKSGCYGEIISDRGGRCGGTLSRKVWCWPE